MFSFSKYDKYEAKREYIDHVKQVTDVFTQAVEHLSSMDESVTTLSQVGAIHVHNEVRPEDYDTIEKAII